MISVSFLWFLHDSFYGSLENFFSNYFHDD